MLNSLPSYFRYWGKAKPSAETAEASYHLLPYHALDVAAVTYVLLQKHSFLRRHLANLMSLPEDQVISWCTFLLGLHDLGKFAESFQQLRPDLRSLLWPNQSILKTNYNVRHDSLGATVWQFYLRDKWLTKYPELEDFTEDVMDNWLNPMFGHHGYPPNTTERLKNYFTTADQLAARDYFEEWQCLINPNIELVVQLSEQRSWIKQQKVLSWVLAGIAVLCDWLGSNQILFRYYALDEQGQPPYDLSNYWNNIALPAATQAIVQTGLLPKPQNANQTLSDLFPFISELTPLQAYCQNIPLTPESQLFILEEVTGAGKTEAALILAKRLMMLGQAQGLYIGLPTMATANAMYERMIEAYAKLYQTNCQPSLILSHSARHLSKIFQTAVLNSQPINSNYQQEENITVQCNRWLADNNKKALLADVGIGTLDQALLAVMPARHQSLRLLGLLNKVLILDEVHAYDAYTNQLLKTLLCFHAALGGSAILLSATLTQEQRLGFIQAFTGKSLAEQATQQAYPLVTHVVQGQLKETALTTREAVKRQVKIEFCHTFEAGLEHIKAAVALGQCICWIRNTVTDARQTYQYLLEQGFASDKIHLFHSRFTLHDRLAIENCILAYFGKDSNRSTRQGRVLIATQVVEQSLDLDFDAMITDLAPIDLLIQRAGRLQRHIRDDQGKCIVSGQEARNPPILIVFSPPLTPDPKINWYQAVFPKAHFVYPHTVILWRTSQILAQYQGWRMPEDARRLLEFVYDSNEENIPPDLLASTQKALGDHYAKQDMGSFSSLRVEAGYSKSAKWDEEAKYSTRLGEENHTVYLAHWDGQQLKPWVEEGRYHWDLSSLRLNTRQVTTIAPVQDAALAEQLKQLKTQETLFNAQSIIIPLQLEATGVWRGRVIDHKQQEKQCFYSEKLGVWFE